MSVGHLDVCFGEVSIHVFCPFLHWIICFLGVEFDKFFIDFWLLTLYLICRLQIIFSHSIGCLLVLLIVSFTVKKIFILMRSQKFIFAFVSLASGDVLSKKLLQPRSKRFLPAFSSRILMASCLTIRSSI